MPPAQHATDLPPVPPASPRRLGRVVVVLGCVAVASIASALGTDAERSGTAAATTASAPGSADGARDAATAGLLAVASVGVDAALALAEPPPSEEVVADEATDDADTEDEEPAATGTPDPDNPHVKPEVTGSVPAGSGSGRRVVFDITAQQVWLINEDGSQHRTYPVSGSRYDQLDPGSYEVFSASRNAISWHHTETMEYMVRFHRGENSNIGFHDIPVVTETGEEIQTLSELGQPLSDGCIRQDQPDAIALWDFAPVGTEVVVVRT